jgi:hypothetical protein
MKHLKLFETYQKSDYYRKLTSDDLTEFNHRKKSPLFTFEYQAIKEIVSLFDNDWWKIYIKEIYISSVGKRFELHIIPFDKDLNWLCWDKQERKKFQKYSDNPENIVECVTINDSNNGYQIYNYDDEYYSLDINDMWGNHIEQYECDQLEGLIQFIKDRELA